MRTLRILAVDDDERILNFVRVKLKALGHEVLTARDGVEALEQAQAQEPDLVLLDVVMPKMDAPRVRTRTRSGALASVRMTTWPSPSIPTNWWRESKR